MSLRYRYYSLAINLTFQTNLNDLLSKIELMWAKFCHPIVLRLRICSSSEADSNVTSCPR